MVEIPSSVVRGKGHGKVLARLRLRSKLVVGGTDEWGVPDSISTPYFRSNPAQLGVLAPLTVALGPHPESIRQGWGKALLYEVFNPRSPTPTKHPPNPDLRLTPPSTPRTLDPSTLRPLHPSTLDPPSLLPPSPDLSRSLLFPLFVSDRRLLIPVYSLSPLLNFSSLPLSYSPAPFLPSCLHYFLQSCTLRASKSNHDTHSSTQ